MSEKFADNTETLPSVCILRCDAVARPAYRLIRASFARFLALFKLLLVPLSDKSGGMNRIDNTGRQPTLFKSLPRV